MHFKKTNNITGWIVFGIALLVYCLTMEETASFWDCGEFISVAYKLQVPHPPGAPLFLLLGRMFSFLSFGDVSMVAYWINFMSALFSALTILFLFWSITHFGRKMMNLNPTEARTEQIILLMGSGLVGALAYTFSDSFWFSAAEAEVYAISSFFTAFVVWGILKWEDTDDEAQANRWIILLSYMIGLSIGVHLLNLVTLPALGLIYYFKKFKVTPWKTLATLIISGGLVLFINNFIVTGLPSLAGKFEILFVNTFHLFFGSGVAFFALLLIGLLTYGIYYTHKKNKPVWNTFLLATAFILIGYSSYTTIVIRSNYDPLINENAPKDVMSFIRYLKREQYGSRPLLYGALYAAKPIDYKKTDPIYKKEKNRYKIIDHKVEYVYDRYTLFPRAWSGDHKNVYQELMGLRNDEYPSFLDNITYMINRQIGYMYARYFMWNFAGREHDNDGAGWLKPAEWGSSEIPMKLAKNKARNNYFMIPLLLGIIGIYTQYVRDKKNFAVSVMLFFAMGIALVFYLNPPPIEPRERDYIYAGSFYAFTFWIGLSVIGIYSKAKSLLNKEKVSIALGICMGLTAPIIMATEGWDDHNRSNRFFSVDSATNYLNSCQDQAVLFTGGDNDTFPLWYAQEVEGCRTDMRVIVFSYFNTDWYIEQSRRQAYQSPPVRYTLSKEDYQQGGLNDYLPYVDYNIPSIDLPQFLTLLHNKNPQLRNSDRHVVPSKVFTLDINKEEIIKKGIVPKTMEDLIVDKMHIPLQGRGLEKKDLAFLDLLATSNWERPLYLNNTSLNQLNVDIQPYIVQEGNAYRVLPVRSVQQGNKLINTERTYDLLMNTFQFRELTNPDAYLSEDYRGFILNHRSSFNDLASSFILKKDLKKARDVLKRSLEIMPDRAVLYDITTITTVDLLYQVDQPESAKEIASTLGARAEEEVAYWLGYKDITIQLRQALYALSELQRILYENDEEELASKYEKAYNDAVNLISP